MRRSTDPNEGGSGALTAEGERHAGTQRPGQKQDDLRDPNGGTYGTPVGTGEQNEAHTTVPAGLEHRKEKTG
jgi:hypothetical protein